MDFTGERVVLGKSPHRVDSEHLARYQYLDQFIKDKIVLDIACGSGYGTDMLAKSAKEAYGVDISPDAIQHANEHYSATNLHFQQGAAGKSDFPDNFFDVVVTYETIEHLTVAVAKEYLADIFRVLKAGGQLFVSTPNRRVVSPNSTFSLVSDFHTHEYTEDELVSFIEQFGFKVDKVLGQRILPKLAVYGPVRMVADAIGKYILKRRVDLYWIPTGPNVVSYDSMHEPRYYLLIAQKPK